MRRANLRGLALLGVERIEQLRLPPAELAVLVTTRLASTGEPTAPGRTSVERALTGESFTEENLIWNAALGRDIRLRSVAAPVKLDGAIIGGVVVSSDITDKHLGVEALQRSEATSRSTCSYRPGSPVARVVPAEEVMVPDHERMVPAEEVMVPDHERVVR
ncbi:MAG: hypothetical protein ABI193_00740 [Minicystis sp.]